MTSIMVDGVGGDDSGMIVVDLPARVPVRIPLGEAAGGGGGETASPPKTLPEFDPSLGETTRLQVRRQQPCGAVAQTERKAAALDFFSF